MRRALPILLALAAAAAPARGRAADPVPPANGGPGADADDAARRAAERAAEAALDAELAAEVAPPSIALGPARRGRPTISADVGWLRSGLRFDLGLASGVDLVARADTMLLYDGLSGQNGVSVGLRATPFAWARGRLTGELTLGQLLSATDAEDGDVTVIRGEVTGGVVLGPATAYARGAVRGLRTGPEAGSGFTGDHELGVGLEASWRRLVGGAEWYALLRPRLDTLPQWRIRLGFAL